MCYEQEEDFVMRGITFFRGKTGFAESYRKSRSTSYVVQGWRQALTKIDWKKDYQKAFNLL
jgi:hypothetical protein